MPGVLLWGWDGTNDVWIPLQVDANGCIKVDMANISLNDLGDVSVASPTDGYVLYWDAGTSLWKCKAVGAGTFLGLTDTPGAYAGQARRPVRVNPAETALEFLDARLFNPISFKRVWYGYNVSSSSRTATISSVSTDVITLTAAVANDFFTTLMTGNSYLKICNKSKSPVEYAWVKDRPLATTLQVTAAADIATWVNGDTISTSYDGVSSTAIEIDISPSVPQGATGIFAYMTSADSGVVTQWKGITITDDPVTGFMEWCCCQIQGITIIVTHFTKISSDRHIFTRQASVAANTLTAQIMISGYTI